ncbi:DUF2264 domain-containing protein [Algoriphagus lutimaris]|nr:DUF2264 domain-containing protein [Algoriphagus lutimaris]
MAKTTLGSFGNGWYGNGLNFHLDYHNSFLIQPMIIQVLEVAATKQKAYETDLKEAKIRMQRFSRQLELMISTEGTYPVIGRSFYYWRIYLLRILCIPSLGRIGSKRNTSRRIE